MPSDQTTRQIQARALGDPTRARIFQRISSSIDPVTVAELTDELGFNHNAIRQHLQVLKEAELVSEETEPRSVRGRPRLVYQPTNVALDTWAAPGSYQHLSELLVEVIRTGASAREVGYAEGQRLAGNLQAADKVRAVAAIANDAASRGFAPRVESDENGTEVVLTNCPFAAVVSRAPATVCGLHLGLAEGFASVVGQVKVSELIPHDPYTAGCQLRLTGATPVHIKSPRRKK